MRKITSYLLSSLDGVVENPSSFVREGLLPDILPLIGETIEEQDSVVLGRKTFEEWAGYWPGSGIEPFSGFINKVPKYVVSSRHLQAPWNNSHRVSGNLANDLAVLKQQAGAAIGVHGSISLVETLLQDQLLDELRIVLLPVIAGGGRRLLTAGRPEQLTLTSARSTSQGIQFLTYEPIRCFQE